MLYVIVFCKQLLDPPVVCVGNTPSMNVIYCCLCVCGSLFCCFWLLVFFVGLLLLLLLLFLLRPPPFTFVGLLFLFRPPLSTFIGLLFFLLKRPLPFVFLPRPFLRLVPFCCFVSISRYGCPCPFRTRFMNIWSSWPFPSSRSSTWRICFSFAPRIMAWTSSTLATAVQHSSTSIHRTIRYIILFIYLFCPMFSNLISKSNNYMHRIITPLLA